MYILNPSSRVSNGTCYDISIFQVGKKISDRVHRDPQKRVASELKFGCDNINDIFSWPLKI